MNQRSQAGKAAQPWWPWAKRLLTLLFFVIVATLLVTQARAVKWDDVLAAMRNQPVRNLWLAAFLTAASFLLYSCFDLLGRRLTGHRLATRKVLAIAFISYAFNINFGSLIGGVAFRYRLYSRAGLDAGTIARVILMSMLTNWIGYMLLAGLAFWRQPIDLPQDWRLGAHAVQALGIGLVAAAVAYVLLCACSRRRIWRIRGQEVTLPSLRMALLQLLLSSANWLLMAGVMYLLLQQKIAFTLVLTTLLASAIAGVLIHVPAGLGVLEAVFVALLSEQMPSNEVLAAVLTYRAIYYLAPLAVAVPAYLLAEARARRAGA